METTSSAPLTVRAASVSAWAKVNCVSNVPRGQVVVVVELARVGHPLVDQDQARRVRAEAARCSASPGLVPALVGLGDERVALRAAELPGQLAPERAAPSSRRASSQGCRASLLPDQHRAPGLGRARRRPPRSSIVLDARAARAAACPTTRW